MEKEINIPLTDYEREYLKKYLILANNFGISEKEVLPMLVYARKLAFVTAYDFERCAFDIIYTTGTHSYLKLDSINRFGYKIYNRNDYISLEKELRTISIQSPEFETKRARLKEIKEFIDIPFKDKVLNMVYVNIDDEDIKRFKVGIPSPPFLETLYKSLFGRLKK